MMNMPNKVIIQFSSLLTQSFQKNFKTLHLLKTLDQNFSATVQTLSQNNQMKGMSSARAQKKEKLILLSIKLSNGVVSSMEYQMD
jgi:hypothetical protein